MNVCVGDEWYRYPSSFFLPGPAYRLQFVKSGFDGMLPLPFDAGQVREDESSSMSPKLTLHTHACISYWIVVISSYDQVSVTGVIRLIGWQKRAIHSSSSWDSACQRVHLKPPDLLHVLGMAQQ